MAGSREARATLSHRFVTALADRVGRAGAEITAGFWGAWAASGSCGAYGLSVCMWWGGGGYYHIATNDWQKRISPNLCDAVLGTHPYQSKIVKFVFGPFLRFWS